MKRKKILAQLINYASYNSKEEGHRKKMHHFIANNVNSYKRESLIGHVTASCWVIDENKEEVLLIHHAKLDKWLQPGGHCDGDEDCYKVAKKELFEETGLIPKQDFKTIFDLDIHLIPKRKDVEGHLHYDVRYLFIVDRKADLVDNKEIKAFKWLRMENLDKWSKEESLLRMRDKLKQRMPRHH